MPLIPNLEIDYTLCRLLKWTSTCKIEVSVGNLALIPDFSSSCKPFKRYMYISSFRPMHLSDTHVVDVRIGQVTVILNLRLPCPCRTRHPWSLIKEDLETYPMIVLLNKSPPMGSIATCSIRAIFIIEKGILECSILLNIYRISLALEAMPHVVVPPRPPNTCV